LYVSLAVVWTAAFLWLHFRETGAKGLPAWGERMGLFALLASAAFVFFAYVFPFKGFERAFPIDDSYITLTAARNVAERNLLAVNPDAPLCGVTSPLHATLTGLLGKLLGVEIAVRVIGLIGYLALAWGMVVWARQLGARFATALGIAFVIVLCGPLTFGALNGMETTPFAALLIWSFVFYEKSEERPRLLFAMGALAGLAILTRPEGWFLAAALFATKLLRHRREPATIVKILGAGLVAGLVVSPYLVANHALLGQWFPPTVSAKKHFFHEWCRPPILRGIAVCLSWTLLFGPTLLIAPLLLFAGVWWRRVYPPLFLGIFYAAYAHEFPGALGHYWGRYQHPLMPIVFIGLALGAARLHERVKANGPAAAKVLGALLAAFFAATAAVGANVQDAAYRHALAMANGYLSAVSKWVRWHSAPGDTVGTVDIGFLYYFGERKVLDLVGLADPEVAKIYAQNNDPECKTGARFDDIYELVQRRRPKILYMVPKIDKLYLQLFKTDGGRHMRDEFSLQSTLAAQGSRFMTRLADKRAALMGPRDDGKSPLTIMNYHFYLCDWDHDLRGLTWDRP
jgi:hypothetical protein